MDSKVPKASPMFSLVMPVFNAEPFLEVCLDGILAQSYREWEAICIDDGSTDGTAGILDDYARKDNRIRVVHDVHEGVSVSRNKGIAMAVGSYIGFVDSDDMMEREWLSNVKELIAEWHPDLVRMNFHYLKNGCRNIHEPVISNKEKVITRVEEICKWGWTTYPNGGWAWLNFIKREVLQQSGVVFPREVSVKEDVVFLLKLIPFLRVVVQSSRFGYTYRIREDSAWHLKRQSADCIKFLSSLLAIWRMQKVAIKNAGCEVVASKELGLAIWIDVLEWIDSRKCNRREGEETIAGLLKDCVGDGILRVSTLPWRWRLGLHCLNRFNSFCLIVLVCRTRRWWVKLRRLRAA